MRSGFDELKNITAVLLDEKADYTSIRNAVADLKSLFYSVTGLDDKLPENQEHIYTDHGLAIGTIPAAECITDMMRTRVFLMGLFEAVSDLLKNNPGKPVTILYAGTGPFAALLVPLTTVFSSSQLKMILLEINPVSFRYLNDTIEHFNLAPYIIDVINTDATSFKIPEKYEPGILLSETMKPALKNEPQVNIVANLVPQCRNAILIPQSIKIDVALMRHNPDLTITTQPIQELMNLTKDYANTINESAGNEDIFTSGLEVEITQPGEPTFKNIVLLTTIKVYNDHCLIYNDCGLTISHKVKEISISDNFPLKLNFKYQRASLPGFVISQI